MGFSNHKLIDADDGRAASYITKYLTKSVISRVRSSQGYGLSSYTDLKTASGDRRKNSSVEKFDLHKQSSATVEQREVRDFVENYSGRWRLPNGVPEQGTEIWGQCGSVEGFQTTGAADRPHINAPSVNIEVGAALDGGRKGRVGGGGVASEADTTGPPIGQSGPSGVLDR